MNKNTRNGLIALGLAGVAAWFKMTPEQRTNVKNKIAGAGKDLKDKLPNDLKNFSQNVKDKLNQTAGSVSNTTQEAAQQYN